MSAYAMTTLGQLQQLTDGQLCIMCHNYRITPCYITPQNRRHIERKLHVAIIEESAIQRALDYIAREKDEQYQQDLYARGRGSEYLPPRPRIQTTSYSSLDIRQSQNVGTMTTPSVHNIHGNRTLWPTPLPYTTRRTYEPERSFQDSSIIPNFVKSFAKELPLMLWRGLENRLAPFKRFRGGEQQQQQQQNTSVEEEPATSHRTLHIQEDDGSNQILSQQIYNTYEEQTHSYPYGLDYEELQRYAHETDYSDIETDRDDASVSDNDERTVQSDSFTSLASSNNEFVADTTAVKKTSPIEQIVQSLFKLPLWPSPASTENILPAALELDHISEHEKVLCTLEYLSDDQKQAEHNKEITEIMERVELRDDSEDEAVILPNRSMAGTRAFFQSIYELLCCDRLGIWNAEKVRCTLFCCGLLVFVCFSFKRLR